MKVLLKLALAAMAVAGTTLGAGATEVERDEDRVTVTAPTTDVDVTSEEVTVDAPYTSVDVDEKSRTVRIRVPYFNGDISW